MIFKGKFSLILDLFKNLNQLFVGFFCIYNFIVTTDPRNNVPWNVPIFMNPRKMGPTKIDDFTVFSWVQFFVFSTQMTHSLGSKFVAIIHTENCFFVGCRIN